MSLGVESAKGFVGKVTQAIIGFLGTIIFARVLGPVEFGGFYLLLTAVKIADRPIRGTIAACRKRYSEADTNRDEILGTLLLAIVLMTVPVSVAGVAFSGVAVRVTSVRQPWGVVPALFLGLTTFAALQMLLGASGQLGRQVWVDVVRSVATFPLQLALVLAGLGGAGMGLGLAGGSVIAAGATFVWLSARPALPSRKTLRSVWEYAQFSIPATFVGKAYDRLDVIIIGVLISSSAVGYYEVAFKLSLPAVFLFSVTTAGLIAKVSNKESRDEPIAADINNAIIYASLLPIPVFFGALALNKELVVTAYGEPYAPAAGLLVLLSAYQLLDSQAETYQAVVDGLDRPDIRLRIDVMALVINVGIGVWAATVYGFLGVAAATVLAEAFRMIASAVAARRLVELPSPIPKPLRRQVVSGIIMYATVLALTNVVVLNDVFSVAAVVGAGASVYGGALLAVSPHARATARAIGGEVVRNTAALR